MTPLSTLARAFPAFAAGIARLVQGSGYGEETRAAIERSKTVIGELEAQARRESRAFIPG